MVTDRDEHAQRSLSSVLRVNVELNGEASWDAAGETGTTSSHFTGVVSGQDPELEGAEGGRARCSSSERHSGSAVCILVLQRCPLTCGGRPPPRS